MHGILECVLGYHTKGILKKGILIDINGNVRNVVIDFCKYKYCDQPLQFIFIHSELTNFLLEDLKIRGKDIEKCVNRREIFKHQLFLTGPVAVQQGQKFIVGDKKYEIIADGRIIGEVLYKRWTDLNK